MRLWWRAAALAAVVGVVGACGPTRAAQPAPGPSSTTLPGATATAGDGEPGIVRPSNGTLAVPGGAATTIAAPTSELPAAGPAGAPPPPRATTPLVTERPDPADAPPPDLPRDPNAGDRSSPYGPFGPFEVQALGADGQQQVAAAVDRYLDKAVLSPWRSGTRADLTGVLTDGALATLQPAQRAVLTEEGSPVVADAAVDQRDVAVDGIVAPDGSAVAVATVTLGVGGTLGGTSVHSTRKGTLTLVPDASGWRIDAFSLEVDRDLP